MPMPGEGNRVGNCLQGLHSHDRACAKKSGVVVGEEAWASYMALHGTSQGRD